MPLGWRARLAPINPVPIAAGSRSRRAFSLFRWKRFGRGSRHGLPSNPPKGFGRHLLERRPHHERAQSQALAALTQRQSARSFPPWSAVAINETSKTRKIWGPLEFAILQGEGIDIGGGCDPVTPQARRFDLADGDANLITRHVQARCDFVYSAHCLEHMRDPRKTSLECWQLVKSGGHLILIVPDEDLYEQGVFPSQFNAAHTCTFTMGKARSWSPVSLNARDLARDLPNAEIIQLTLHDHGSDRRLLLGGRCFGFRPPAGTFFYVARLTSPANA